MPSGSWEIWLEEDVQIRTRMTLDRRGNVRRFTVQLELYLDRWRPVVRYDNAHGEAHIDYINPEGVTYEKVWLNVYWPYNDVMTVAEHELKRTYDDHIARFREQLEGH